MNITVEQRFGEYVVAGYVDGRSLESIVLNVTRDSIRCLTSTAIPTNSAEEYIELYSEVMGKAWQIQERMMVDARIAHLEEQVEKARPFVQAFHSQFVEFLKDHPAGKHAEQ